MHDALRKIASKADMSVIPTKPTPDDLEQFHFNLN